MYDLNGHYFGVGTPFLAEGCKTIYFVGSGEPRILRDYLLSMGEVLGNEKLLGIGERPDDNIQFNLEWFNTNDLEVDTGFMVQNSFEENIKNIKCLK